MGECIITRHGGSQSLSFQHSIPISNSSMSSGSTIKFAATIDITKSMLIFGHQAQAGPDCVYKFVKGVLTAIYLPNSYLSVTLVESNGITIHAGATIDFIYFQVVYL